MLCPSCRRQLERGASYCGSCGTPLNGASAPLELVLGDATRVPVVAEMTIGRAPGRVAGARRPVGLARARADLRRRGARGRRLLARDVAGRRAGDRARRRCATGRRSGSATPSCASSAGATRPRPGGRSSCAPGASLLVPSVGAGATALRRRSSGCGRACARATRSSGSTPPRAARRWVLRDLRRGHVPAALRQRRVRCSSCSTARTSLVELVGLRRAALRRRPGRRGWRGCCPTSASAGSSTGVAGGAAAGRAAARAGWQRLFKPREKVFPGVGAVDRARSTGAAAGCSSRGRC